MYFEKIKLSEIPKRSFFGKFEKELLLLVKDFVSSGYEGAEIKDFTQKNARSFIASARKTAKRNNIENVRFIVSGGKVFIIKNHEKDFSIIDKK